MEKLKDLHDALEKLQRDASKKHYPQSELDKKRENPEHILQKHYYNTTAAERNFMDEFVKAIENPLLIADEGKYANLVDAIAVELPGILREALHIIHTPEARKFVEAAKAEIVPFIREHKTFLENHDLDAKAAIKAAEKIPVGQALYERAISASHGEIRRLKMQNRALLAGEERLETRLDRLDTRVDTLKQDKKDLKKEVDLSVDYALEQQDEAARLQTDLEQTRTHLEAELDSLRDLPERLSQYESDNAQLETEKERLAREKEEAEQKAQELETEAASLRDLPERLSQYESENTQLKAEKETAETEVEAAKSQILFWQKNAEESGSIAAEKEQELSDAYKNLEAKEAELAKALEEAEQANVVDQEQEERIQDLIAEKTSLETQLEELRTRGHEGNEVVSKEFYDGAKLRYAMDVASRDKQITNLQEQIEQARQNAVEEGMTVISVEDKERLEADISEYKARIERFTEAAARDADTARERDQKEADLKDFYEAQIQRLQNDIAYAQNELADQKEIVEDLRRKDQKNTDAQKELEAKLARAQEEIDLSVDYALEQQDERIKVEEELVSLKSELRTNEEQIKQLYENITDLESEAQMWHELSKEATNLVDGELTVDESEVDSEDFKLSTPPELGGPADESYKLGVPPELGGAAESDLEASVESADVTELRAQLAAARAELEKHAEQRYDIFFIAENDTKNSVEVRIELYKEYLRIEPDDMHIAGVVYNNYAELLGNEFNKYTEAEALMTKAIECAEKDCALVQTEEAKERITRYKANLASCARNKQLLDLGVATIDKAA